VRRLPQPIDCSEIFAERQHSDTGTYRAHSVTNDARCHLTSSVDVTPANPGAWLMAAAKRRAVDLLRRQATLDAQRIVRAKRTPPWRAFPFEVPSGSGGAGRVLQPAPNVRSTPVHVS
jgi:predicted RNA polymerase sigma factor